MKASIVCIEESFQNGSFSMGKTSFQC